MNPLRILGHFLLWMGFLSGAFVAVRNTENAASPWNTVSWPAYFAALVVAIAGVVLLRRTRRRVATDAAGHTAAIDRLLAILVELEATIGAWSQDPVGMPRLDLHEAIDRDAVPQLTVFAELRESLAEQFGLTAYANIMTEFALAERTINRAWSASADGYVDEVEACLRRAATHLAAARQQLKAQLRGSSS